MPISQDRMREVLDASMSFVNTLSELQKLLDHLATDPAHQLTAIIVRGWLGENGPGYAQIAVLAGEDRKFTSSYMRMNEANRRKQQRYRAGQSHQRQKFINEEVRKAENQISLENYQVALSEAPKLDEIVNQVKNGPSQEQLDHWKELADKDKPPPAGPLFGSTEDEC